MICPECKKNNTSVINSNYDKFVNAIKRDRYCTCGYKFITYEINQSEFKSQTSKILKTFKKVNKVKRKVREDSVWKNIRFIIYSSARMSAAIEGVTAVKKKLESKKIENIGTKEISGTKINQKSYWGIQLQGWKKPIIQKIEKKKDTIKKLVKHKNYWILRNKFLKDSPIEDMNNPDKVRREVQQFFKSVCTYIKNNEFNQDFFSKFAFSDDEKKIWKETEFWNIWLMVR